MVFIPDSVPQPFKHVLGTSQPSSRALFGTLLVIHAVHRSHQSQSSLGRSVTNLAFFPRRMASCLPLSLSPHLKCIQCFLESIHFIINHIKTIGNRTSHPACGNVYQYVTWRNNMAFPQKLNVVTI